MDLKMFNLVLMENTSTSVVFLLMKFFDIMHMMECLLIILLVLMMEES